MFENFHERANFYKTKIKKADIENVLAEERKFTPMAKQSPHKLFIQW